MAKLTQKEFEKKFYSIFSPLEYRVVGEYIDSKTPIEILHISCNTILYQYPNNMFSRKKISCCVCDPLSNKTVVRGKNDLATTNQELFALLLNKEDGYKYRQHSCVYVWFVCPYCGRKHYKLINTVSYDGLNCPCCNDNVSYAEKFFISLLSQLNINYDFQYSPEWIGKRRYDFRFDMNGISYIIELDGGVGHGNNGDIESKEIDEFKDLLAEQYGHHVIRVDCYYKNNDYRKEYIINSIVHSELNNILDLNNAKYDECNKFALNSFCKYIADLWTQGVHSYDELHEFIPVQRQTLRRYLKQASEIGLIKDSYSEILNVVRKFSNQKIVKSSGTKVYCNETGEMFDSYSRADKAYPGAKLTRYFSSNGRQSGGHLPDGTKLTWTKIEK